MNPVQAQDVRLRRLAREAERLTALEEERIEAMAAWSVEVERRRLSIARAYLTQATTQEIADEHGCSPSYVSKCARDYGLTPRGKGRNLRKAA